jgi:type I restriction enzyme M protein
MANQKNNNSNRFEQTLWAAADKLRGHLDAANCQYIVFGLILLKHKSNIFQVVVAD